LSLFLSDNLIIAIRFLIGYTQRTRLGDGGALSCVTLGRLPLNKGKKVEFKFLLFGCVLSSWNRSSIKFLKLQYEFCRPPLLPNLVLAPVFILSHFLLS